MSNLPKIISIFNHKGGVSKTTTSFHLGWMIAKKGYRVLLVDADPQCNLSGIVFKAYGEDYFDHFYSSTGKNNNIKFGLSPAFDALPKRVSAIECVQVKGEARLFLLPGHIELSEYEVALGIAQELSGSIQTLQNLPGSMYELLRSTSKKLKIDYVIVDMNPSLSSINQNLLMISDYFLIPNSPDYFSIMALQSLSKVLPRWKNWADRASSNDILKRAAYPFPKRAPKFLGNVIQNYRIRSGVPTIGFQNWISQINAVTRDVLLPALERVDMRLEDKIYATVGLQKNSYCLALVPVFNTLAAKSQTFSVPVFALNEEQLGSAGVVLENEIESRDNFFKIYSECVEKILKLTYVDI